MTGERVSAPRSGDDLIDGFLEAAAKAFGRCIWTPQDVAATGFSHEPSLECGNPSAPGDIYCPEHAILEDLEA